MTVKNTFKVMKTVSGGQILMKQDCALLDAGVDRGKHICDFQVCAVLNEPCSAPLKSDGHQT